MRIADLGEFPLIDRVAQIVDVERPDVIVGIGDDVAVLRGRGGEWILAKVDSQVEGVHFKREAISPHQLGRRALTINLSDIAAAGGRAEWALVSLALPTDTEVTWVDQFYQGMMEEGSRFGVAIVGGNMARLETAVFIDVFVLGHVRPEHLLLRSGAVPGDRVLVTGTLGDSTAGLSLLQDPALSIPSPEREMLLSRHFTPTPRLSEAGIIAGSGLATGMIDLSDGLSSDIGHICDRSHVGVRLWAERLPISQATRRVAELTGREPWHLALDGGEDYELCFTVPPDKAEDLIAAVEGDTGTPVTVVGEILASEGGRWLQVEDGRAAPLEAKGWQHFQA
jgi:thiamine-monophosphate kinase